MKNIDKEKFKDEYQVRNGKYIFIPVQEEVVTDFLDKIKYKIKKFNKIYSALIEIISPVYPQPFFDAKRIIRNEIRGKNVVALNLGSGNSDFGDDLLNVDLLPYQNVDIICDIENIPFKDNSVDYIINIAVLEHVPNPQKVIAEIHRVLKPGGKIYSFIPFMQPFHASPYDFQRFTFEGMKHQFRAFDILKLKPIGPTSGMLWVVQEWFALVFSFGIKPLHTVLYLLFMVLTFPIKFLDVIFQFYPMSKNVASGFSILAQKK
ncbi:class I SAM-dependent methyltransferase [Chryseobacterium antibioticum]|uniref:Class I SAM-dependent methyltransferase n=2 Tax=Chryseobacterium TaxID=59732 RepID=A0A7Y0AL98_9FLAO|nr:MULTISPECIES: class I SAM-dependent methyltransferase [Chryseobacterium]MCT2407864.1 class I SAM-dependent methyltransferase [Chryseobacterium pyrolae]NML69371.1 class I SAM-dependent methyltransferase [Chryseobacterium antibioticum]